MENPQPAAAEQTPAHEARAAELLSNGYTEVETAGQLSVGQRVRHVGEQYSDAIWNGTAVIERIFTKADGKDVELIARRDKPGWSATDTHGFWADYHTSAVLSLDELTRPILAAQPNPTVAELDALASGSIAIILDAPDDKWPEAFLRHGSGWTRLEPGPADNNIPSEGLLIRPEESVLIVFNAGTPDEGKSVSSVEGLEVLPEGTLVRGLGRRSNPAWPRLLRRVYNYPGLAFVGSSPDLSRKPVSAEAATSNYGELTVIWEPK